MTESYRDAAQLLRRASRLGRTDFDARYSLVLDMIFTALAGRKADERNRGAGSAGRAALVRNLIGCAVGALQGPPASTGRPQSTGPDEPR